MRHIDIAQDHERWRFGSPQIPDQRMSIMKEHQRVGSTQNFARRPHYIMVLLIVINNQYMARELQF